MGASTWHLIESFLNVSHSRHLFFFLYLYTKHVTVNKWLLKSTNSNYDSEVIITNKVLIFTTLDSQIMIIEA